MDTGTPLTSEPLISEIEEQAELPVEDHSARNRLVIGLLLVSAFVVILNETIMGVAIPRMMESLSIPASKAQWLTTAFMLTMAVVIPITGSAAAAAQHAAGLHPGDVAVLVGHADSARSRPASSCW